MIRAAIRIALRLVEARAKAVVEAVVMGDAGGRIWAVGIVDTVLDATVTALEIGQALLFGGFFALLGCNTFSPDAEGIGIVVAVACAGCRA